MAPQARMARNSGFAKACKQKLAENATGFGIEPVTWTTLPPDFGYDTVTDWPFEVTEPEEPIADTQKSKDGQTRINIMRTGRLTTTPHCDKRTADAFMRDIERRLRGQIS